MRKIKKLINNPNRFFFDYFAKRLGSNQVNNVAPKAPVNRGVSSYLSPANFTFDKNVHPWTQVAEAFDLRTGATSGHPDQSLLVNSTDHLSVLMYACWLTHAFNYSLKVYTLGGAISQEIKGLDLLNIGKVEGLYKKLHTKSDYVLEMSGTFDNNFALHIFLYDIKDELYEVRARNAFVKKIKRESFNEIYPAPINNFGQYEFGTPWPVDIVYTWVNKDDLDWVSLWNSNFPETPFDPDRFSSKDELKYSLRSICKFLPWFNTIYIVSNCKKPDWLVEHPKLKWVDHQDIFPDQNALPTFNSHAIEACLHKIDGLNERFIYLNDDMFVNSPSYYADFYDPLGRTIAHFEPYGMVYDNNIFDDTKDYLSPSINCQRLIKNVFPFYTATQLHKHSPYALRKSVMDEIETLFRQNFNTTRAAKLRTADDINVTSFLYHHYGLASGKTICSEFSYLIVRPRNIRTIAGSQARTFKYLCFNDGDGSSEDKKYIEQYFKLVNNLYPCPSPFEQECKQWNSIKISKTIMAYYKREHRIPEIRKMIGDANVSLDDGSWGLWENAKRSWMSFDAKCDYHLVIQDDAVVCRSFYNVLASHINIEPNRFMCLYFRYKSHKTHSELNFAGENGVSKNGFLFPRLQWGLALLCPANIVKDMVSFADEISDVKMKNKDDLRFSQYLSSINHSVYYPLPSLVDQSADCTSLIGHGDNIGRQATYFIDGENRFNNL
ncbi:stealth conserved region 3 domain-containing protein [Aeromonas bivalvium]|uniref:stealth conserved region 3 domain-containing protein n=1 Tax=Aeromonas bivalvium TaxID=440079 RepID=UPI0038D009AE